MKSIRNAVAKTCVAASLGLLALGAQALELRGFRGVMWGEGAEALGTARVVGNSGKVTCYQRERENLLFGDSALTGVRYCFHEDQLVLVAIDAAVSSQALTAQFEHTYGKPAASKAQSASWGNRSTSARAEVVAQGSAARLSLYTNKLDPMLAKQIHQLATADASQRVASAF
jgi:hypothetical protein